jgi:anti-sigma factor RsiW
MRCDEALPLLYDLADDEIDREGAVAVAAHLGECPACAVLWKEIRSREALYRERLSPAATPPLSDPEELAERIWREAAPRLPLSEDRAPLAFALGCAAAAALAAAGTSNLWAASAVARWRDVIDGFTRAAAELPAGPLELLASARTALASSVEASRSLPAFAALGLGLVVAVQLAGSAWLLRGRAGARPGAGPREA